MLIVALGCGTRNSIIWLPAACASNPLPRHERLPSPSTPLPFFVPLTKWLRCLSWLPRNRQLAQTVSQRGRNSIQPRRISNMSACQNLRHTEAWDTLPIRLSVQSTTPTCYLLHPNTLWMLTKDQGTDASTPATVRTRAGRMPGHLTWRHRTKSSVLGEASVLSPISWPGLRRPYPGPSLNPPLPLIPHCPPASQCRHFWSILLLSSLSCKATSHPTCLAPDRESVSGYSRMSP